MRYRHGQPSRRRRAGLTLTELMVSTGILAWMIIVANQMLVSSRQAIREAEGIIRSNANARAVATRIREDLEQVSSDGVLMIMEVPAKLGVQRRSALSFTSVGSYQSVTDPTVKSNLARVDYGLSMNPNASWYRKDDRGTASLDDDIAFGVLYRRAMVSLPGLGSDLKQDYENMCLSYYRFQPMAPASNLETWMGGITAMWTNNNHPEGSKQLAHIGNPMYEGPVSTVQSLFLPVIDLAELENLWPYMLGEVSYLNFQWTDGSRDTDGNLRWFGYRRDADGKDVLTPRNANWSTVSAADDNNPVMPITEFRRTNDGINGVYCAFWSYKRRHDWPKALKVQFKVGDPPRSFELIVGIPAAQ